MSGTGKSDEEIKNEAVMLLDLILPLAKGYAAQHPVGSNQDYVNEVDNFLSALREARQQESRSFSDETPDSTQSQSSEEIS